MAPSVRTAVRFLLLVAAYVAAAAVALFYVDSPSDITLIWPSTGIARWSRIDRSAMLTP